MVLLFTYYLHVIIAASPGLAICLYPSFYSKMRCFILVLSRGLYKVHVCGINAPWEYEMRLDMHGCGKMVNTTSNLNNNPVTCHFHSVLLLESFSAAALQINGWQTDHKFFFFLVHFVLKHLIISVLQHMLPCNIRLNYTAVYLPCTIIYLQKLERNASV